MVLVNVLQSDGDEFIEIAQQINTAWTSETKCTDLDADLIRQFAYQATGNICPMQAVIGGIAAQEVMKVSFSMINIQLMLTVSF